MAASLLKAVGLPELITGTLAEYTQLGIDLAMSAERLSALKQKLAGNRACLSAFDTHSFTKHLEAAFILMYERYKASLPAAHIAVRP